MNNPSTVVATQINSMFTAEMHIIMTYLSYSIRTLMYKAQIYSINSY